MEMTKRGRRQAETRRRLLAAAREVFGRRGFYDASLEEIADAAGYTTGAVYSNFAGKEELFLALLDDTTARHVDMYERVMADANDPGARTHASAGAFMEFLKSEPEAWTLFMEFWVHAVRDDDLRLRLAPGHEALRDAIAEM